MGNILPFAEIKVEVLNDYCWQQCEDFNPVKQQYTYATDSAGNSYICSRTWVCKDLHKCKRLSLYLERSEEK